jgi:hypothetical protein
MPFSPFVSTARDYVVAFYQTQRNALIIIITLLIALYILTGTDQAGDMIEAVISSGVGSPLFLFILIGAFLWSWTVYSSTRLILHVSPVGLRLSPAMDTLLRWLPRLGGMLPSLILAFAFWETTHIQPFLLVGMSVLLLWSFRLVEQYVPVFAVPTRWTFRNRYTSIVQDFRALWRHPLGRLVVSIGFILTAVLLILFSLPVQWGIARYFRPTAVILFGISVYTFWGSLLVYFNDYRYRPLLLVVGLYFVAVSAFNDNTTVRTSTDSSVPPISSRPTVDAHFARWVEARRGLARRGVARRGVAGRLPSREFTPSDTIPLILIAAEGGGIRALNWTAETLIRLDSIIPGFSRHVYALSGVSGGGVGIVFYTAFLRDIAETRRISRFAQFRRVIRDDYLSAVSAALLFPEAIQRLSPVALPSLERGKWLEDSWADSYQRNLGLSTLDSAVTSLYQRPGGYNYDLPSLLLNGTLAESGQKVITSNLKLDSRYFRDVVSTVDLLGHDVPLKTAASLCSRFPVVTNGALLHNSAPTDGRIQPYGGHVVDGGYFDNSGVETCFQLLNNLVPSIRRLDSTGQATVIPYILFIQNSNTMGRTTRAQSVMQIVRIPLLGFFNAWDNGSITRDNMFNSFVDRFTNPRTNYLTLRLAYNDRYPLGWYLSERVANRLSDQARDSISLKNPALRQLQSAFRRAGVR